MRKLLLATTALVGSVAFAGAANASPAPTSPITLNVGGYVDFVAGFYHSAQGAYNTLANASVGNSPDTLSPSNSQTSSRDFETEFKINFDAMGKASNGMQYGADVGLWNGPEVTNLWTGGGSTIELNSAYVWLSGAFGKAMFGDSHGASDLFVYAPTVGEGQLDGRYMDFVSPFTLARFQPGGIDNTEHSTNVTYYTPKVGNDDNKVQLGVTYEPNMYDYGSNVTKTTNTNQYSFGGTNLLNGTTSPYQDVVKADLAYWGNFRPVTLAASAQIETGSSGANIGANGAGNAVPMFFTAPTSSRGQANDFQDFTAWGLGTQVGIAGFTVGGAYNDLGRYGTVHGQNKAQQTWNLGGKYEFDKVAVAANWLNGEGYDNMLVGGIAGTQPLTNINYVSSFNAYGLGATYTWFPGLTSAIDGTIFSQDVRDERDHNDGYVILISQKMTF